MRVVQNETISLIVRLRYRSYHVVVEYTVDTIQTILAEIQIRTLVNEFLATH